MVPVYRPGDVLIGPKRVGQGIARLIGRDSIVQTEKGDRYVKILNKSPLRNHYNLRSYNLTSKDIEAVRLAWAAPIEWIKRGG
jgi:phage repressor protein C with HTH and peptisase S24 domain